jgi:hypothetical protein
MITIEAAVQDTREVAVAAATTVIRDSPSERTRRATLAL